MASKSFDLNIEQILENWEVRHGIIDPALINLNF